MTQQNLGLGLDQDEEETLNEAFQNFIKGANIMASKDEKEDKNKKNKKEDPKDKSKSKSKSKKDEERGEEIDLDESDHKILNDIWKERQEETRKKLEEAARKKKDKK